MITELTKPTVHLNGTSKASLAEALEAAGAAIHAAERTLRETAPNGRDYYPQGDCAIYKAQREYVSRLRRLISVREELELLREHLEEVTTRAR
jgi:hypothetical protein